MRDAIVELGIEGRIGVESGEVVVGTAERLVTGRAVTSAARLEQAAQPGEILVGEGTMRLAGEAVTAEPIEPLELKGKREPVPAWRLLSVSADAPARRFDSPFVGRERELATARRGVGPRSHGGALRAGDGLGAAGVGKSRLVRELAAADRRGSRPGPLPLLRGRDHLLARRRCRDAAAAEPCPTSNPPSHRRCARCSTTTAPPRPTSSRGRSASSSRRPRASGRSCSSSTTSSGPRRHCST